MIDEPFEPVSTRHGVTQSIATGNPVRRCFDAGTVEIAAAVQPPQGTGSLIGSLVENSISCRVVLAILNDVDRGKRRVDRSSGNQIFQVRCRSTSGMDERNRRALLIGACGTIAERR